MMERLVSTDDFNLAELEELLAVQLAEVSETRAAIRAAKEAMKPPKPKLADILAASAARKQQMFKWHDEGVSYTEIARRLNRSAAVVREHVLREERCRKREARRNEPAE